MKVYLAARYSAKNEMREHAAKLRAAGIEVTSSWLEEPHSPQTKLSELADETFIEYATVDIQDVQAADWLVFFSVNPETPMVRGGRHVEFGYAMGLGKKLLVVGPRENIFHFLPFVHLVNSFDEALKFLQETPGV